MGKKKPKPIWVYERAGGNHLRFSFKHLDLTSQKFPVSGCGDPAFLLDLIGRMKEYSAWPVEQFRDNNNTAEHRHQIYFPATSEQRFPGIDPDEFADAENWQFAVSATPGCLGRVHGVLLGDTFFVVWFDSCHRLYPKPGSC
jgi:hypothetical protein